MPAPVQMFGRYELIPHIGPIGRGGMAEVHLAIERGPGGLGKLAVVKIIHAHLASQPAVVEMLRDEARLAALVKHPNVVDIYDVGEANGRHYIAMEYLEGEPLLAVLRAGIDGRRLDPLSIARVIADAASGLEAAHRLLVHHDVSPGNIVVLYAGGRVKLVDFGVAKAARGTDADATQVHGKVAYMAPEKIEHAASDRRCDIWSLGVVAYEALTLTRLFQGDRPEDTVRQVMTKVIVPPSHVNPDVPVDLDHVVLKALARDPAARYQTAQALADALAAVLPRDDGTPQRIAAYMQRTFGATITARTQLLREVLGEGRPSHAVIEAAFGRAATQPILPDELEEVAEEIVEVNAAPVVGVPPSRRRWVTVAGAAAVSIGIVAVVVMRREPGAAAVVPDEIVVASAVPLDATGEVPTDAAADPPRDATQALDLPADEPTDEGGEPEEIEMGGSVVRKPGSVAPRKPKADAPSLYTHAMQRLRARDPKGALASLDQARKLDPNHAPVWYGLGLVYAQLGQRGQAKSAYLRYLSIAPRAANAAAVRAEIERL